jgi:hypothetical protein
MYFHYRFIIYHLSSGYIYNYIPETTYVSRVYSVAAVLYLQTVLHVMPIGMSILFFNFYNITSRIECAVLTTGVLCSPLISCFPDMLLGCFILLLLLLLLLLIFKNSALRNLNVTQKSKPLQVIYIRLF